MSGANETRGAVSSGDDPLLSERGMITLSLVLLALEACLVGVLWVPSDWHPLGLLAVLASFVFLSEVGGVYIRGIFVSSSSVGLLLAMALLGPVPAAALGAATGLVDRFVYKLPTWAVLSNTFMFSTFCLVGGLLFEVFEDVRADSASGQLTVVFGVGIAVTVVNFAILIALRRLRPGTPLGPAIRRTYLPSLPYQIVSVTLAAAAAHVYTTTGLPMIAAIMGALLVSEALLRTVGSSLQRADELIDLSREREELLRASLIAEETERAWIAEHLHDETLQRIAVVEQDLADAHGNETAAISSAREGLTSAIGDLRRTLAHAHPIAMAEVGLEQALRVYADQVCRRGPECRVNVDRGIDRANHAILYSLMRELLVNAVKHGRPEHVTVTINRAVGQLTLTVTDDGVGFDPEAPPVVGHMGLAATYGRARAAGGSCVVTSAPGAGTTVEVELPLVQPDAVGARFGRPLRRPVGR